MIRALIVDDEPPAREELAVLLQETGAFEILGSCANAMEAVKQINSFRPEVLFLDIEMPLLGGFELLGMIDEETMPHVVFVTAYDEFALQAFEEKTLDYLLKPIDPERFSKTVAKLKGLLLSGERARYQAPPLARIPCLRAHKIKLVDPEEVEFIRSDPGGIMVAAGQGEFFTDLTLKVLETRTPLVRCHKRFLVNLQKIDEIQLIEGGLAEIQTRGGHTLPVSRRYLKGIREFLKF